MTYSSTIVLHRMCTTNDEVYANNKNGIENEEA